MLADPSPLLVMVFATEEPWRMVGIQGFFEKGKLESPEGRLTTAPVTGAPDESRTLIVHVFIWGSFGGEGSALASSNVKRPALPNFFIPREKASTLKLSVSQEDASSPPSPADPSPAAASSRAGAPASKCPE